MSTPRVPLPIWRGLSKRPISRRFRVRVDGGGQLLVDLSSWPLPAFSAAIAPLLQELIRQMGPAPVRRTVYCKVLDLRRFWRFLDDTATAIGNIDDITVELIDRYENWLEQNTPSQAALRRLISPLIALLRLAVEQIPNRLPQSLVNRLNWLGRGEFASSRPRNAYSTGVTAALRAAARRQIAEAAKGALTGDAVPARRADIEACPSLHPYHDAVIDVLVREGWIGTRNPVFWRFKAALWNRKLPGLPLEALHGSLHLTRIDLVGFLVLLSLETGMEIECLKSLKADCLRNPSRGYVEIEYRNAGAGRAMEAPAGPRWRQLDARRHHPAGDPADGAGAPASGHGRAVGVVERIRAKRSKDRSEERARVRRPA